MKRLRFLSGVLVLILMLSVLFVGCSKGKNTSSSSSAPSVSPTSSEGDGIGEFKGEPYVVINENVPNFTEQDKKLAAFESYSPLDSLGRCGVAFACVTKELMPTEDRGSIGQVKPSGWHTVKYDCVDGKYLYNRCHLIGFQLTGENANELNLITGTRYFNVIGMLPFENMVADYVKETGNRVLYRVTPVYRGNDLVAHGAYMEAYSIEDDGEGICFNVYAYNAQPGIVIDYATGESRLATDKPVESEEKEGTEFILNTNTKKVHTPDCSRADDIKASNRKTFIGTFAELELQGYSGCTNCSPWLADEK